MANELKLDQVITNVMINHIGAEGRHIGEGGCPRIQWYALRNEITKAITAWNTRPAAPVEVLDRYNLNASFDGPGDAFCAAVKSKKGVFVRFDQAKAIIAAEREAQQRLLDIIEEANTDKSALDADNAALTARVKAQIEHIATLDSNLEAMEKRAQEGETQLAAARNVLSVFLSEYDALYLFCDEPPSMVSAVEAARAALEDLP